MRYDILCIFLNLFVSISASSPTTGNECKHYANHKDSDYKEKELELERVETALQRLISCARDPWSRENPGRLNFSMWIRPSSADFDEESGKLDLKATTSIWVREDRLKWNKSEFPLDWTIFKAPDVPSLIIGLDDIYERRENLTNCRLFSRGNLECHENHVRTIKCTADLTLWPHENYNCSIILTSSFIKVEEFSKNSHFHIGMNLFKPDGKWNLGLMRTVYGIRKSYLNDNTIHPQIRADFVLFRLHTSLKRRFIGLSVIMTIMTLTALWLDPKSYERLVVASLNIVIHMTCIQDLHWALPHRNSITVPKILLFYMTSFILAIVVLPLTFCLGKIKNTKKSPPKWISSSVDRFVKSKTGQILLLVMLDPKVMTGIETRADDTDSHTSSEAKKFTWKYIAIFVGWISFFSFVLAYILMYIVLIPQPAVMPSLWSSGII